MRFFLPFFTFLFLSFSQPFAQALDPEKMIKNWVNFSCIDFRIKGICIKHKHGHIKIGIKVSYYLPVALVETPPVSYQTEIKPLRPVLKAAEPAAEKLVSSIPILSSTHYEISGNMEAEEDTFYRDAHIFSFPGIANPALQLLAMFCDKPTLPYFVWLSETDPLDWRLGLRDYLRMVTGLPAKLSKLKSLVLSFSSAATSPTNTIRNFLSQISSSVRNFVNSLKGIGASSSDWKALLSKSQEAADKVSKFIPDGGWGSKTPHVGYVHDVSSTIAYHLIAVRALDLSFPYKPRWGKDKFQMILPTTTGCYKLGDDRIKTETGKMLKGDTPVWLYWYKFECCIF